jgi:DNA-binding Lrp family transcriptional regulator
MKESIKIDAKDKKLLYELNCNSRQSLSDLARRVGLGRDLIAYRVRRLETEGVITKYAVVINPYRLGFTLYKTYLRLRNNPERVAALKKALRNHARIYCIGECDGTWDLLFNTLAESPYAFHRIQSDFLGEFHDIILATNVSTVVNHWYFPKKYLFKGTRKAFHVGGLPEKVICDEKELRILEILSNDARATLAEICDKVTLTPAAVKNRIERLEKTGVILGYHTQMDRKKLGLTYFKARILHTDNRAKDFTRLFDFAFAHADICYLIEQIGDCKIELAIEVQGLTHFNEVLDTLRREFPLLIGNVETILIQNDRYRWLPLGELQAAVQKGM